LEFVQQLENDPVDLATLRQEFDVFLPAVSRRSKQRFETLRDDA
jgi:hypothetical protein